MARLHRNVEAFGEEAAAAYDRGRAPFPPVLIDALGIPDGSRVLDLAAGTGLLSGALADAGYDVVGVEPMPAMRARLAERLGERRALDGTAEAIPVPDGTVDAVTVADAFHWFDGPAAVAEIHRVLRPGGSAVLIFRETHWPDAPAWWSRLRDRMTAMRGPHPYFDDRDRDRDAFAAHGGFLPAEATTVDYPKPTDPDGVLDYLRSISYVAKLPDNVRRAFIDDVRADLRDARVGRFDEPQRAYLTVVGRR